MKIEQTEQGIEISITEENEDLFESMENYAKELTKKYPLLAELSDFVKIDWNEINKLLDEDETDESENKKGVNI